MVPDVCVTQKYTGGRGEVRAEEWLAKASVHSGTKKGFAQSVRSRTCGRISKSRKCRTPDANNFATIPQTSD